MLEAGEGEDQVIIVAAIQKYENGSTQEPYFRPVAAKI